MREGDKQAQQLRTTKLQLKQFSVVKSMSGLPEAREQHTRAPGMSEKKKKKSRSTSLVSTHQPTTNTEHLLLCLQDPCNNVVY